MSKNTGFAVSTKARLQACKRLDHIGVDDVDDRIALVDGLAFYVEAGHTLTPEASSYWTLDSDNLHEIYRILYNGLQPLHCS